MKTNYTYEDINEMYDAMKDLEIAAEIARINAKELRENRFDNKHTLSAYVKAADEADKAYHRYNLMVTEVAEAIEAYYAFTLQMPY